MNSDFSWSNCRDKRWADMRDINDWDETDTIELSKGDVVVVRFFKSSPISETYTYLEKVIYNNDDIIEYKTETIISREFILVNCEKSDKEKYLFTHVTKSFERDKKIDLVFR